MEEEEERIQRGKEEKEMNDNGKQFKYLKCVTDNRGRGMAS